MTETPCPGRLQGARGQFVNSSEAPQARYQAALYPLRLEIRLDRGHSWRAATRSFVRVESDSTHLPIEDRARLTKGDVCSGRKPDLHAPGGHTTRSSVEPVRVPSRTGYCWEFFRQQRRDGSSRSG